jgi:hypothetical protein
VGVKEGDRIQETEDRRKTIHGARFKAHEKQ